MEQDEGNASLASETATFPQLQEPDTVSEEAMITNIWLEVILESFTVLQF